MNQKTTLSLLIAMTMGTASAAPSTLFISEYIEGSSNNKAIEIANLTGETVDLTSYQIQMYFNGNTSASLSINLEGTLADGEVYVLAQANANDQILAVADQTQGSGWFNGDDAVVLMSADNIIDSIGQVGFDPGSAWSSDGVSTANMTLRRDLTIDAADTDTTNSFNPATEWQSFERDLVDGLGFIDGAGDDSDGGNDDDGSDDQTTFACYERATPIHLIQGVSSATTMNGENVEIEGVVVGDFQASDQLRGFFIQEESIDYDDNSETSEGIFVYSNNYDLDVKFGDAVRVAGRVGEYSSMTQLSNITQIEICAENVDVTPSVVSLPLASSTALEKLEGMLVTIEQPLTVSENYNLGRYGELVLSNGRLFNPTNVVSPGVEAAAMQAENDLNRIVLDDGSSRQNPAMIIHPQPELSAFNSVRSGDQVREIVGVINQAFGAYRIQPSQPPVYESTNARTIEPKLADSPLKIASFNVLNYFNGDGAGGAFPTPRGADTVEEFERQSTKIISALTAMDADVIGLMEIENDGYESDSAIAHLVFSLNQVSGRNFHYVRPSTSQLGTDAIAVGLIYDADKVEQIGQAVSIATGAFADLNRQPLAQSFREIESNGRFTVVVNHFKSKGSCPSDANNINADQGDGQGCWNNQRLLAANELVAWLETNPTGVNDSDRLILGDLNAYAMEDPIKAIEALGYENLVDSNEYSYVFNGQAGSLDHALASTSLSEQVVDTVEWHINSDEPRVLDYNTEYKSVEQITSLYNADAYRASDHDPVIVGVNLLPSFDVNNDGNLNFRDIISVIRHFRNAPVNGKRKYDLNQDSKINIIDLVILLRAIKQSRR